MAPKTPKTPQSAGRVQTRAEWKNCVSCLATFVARDSLKHEVVCSALATGELPLAEINHGFILDRKLNAVFEENGCKDCLQLAAKVQASHVMLISPSAMQLCGIEIGSHILAETCAPSNIMSTFIAWPCSHIPPSSFVINSEVLRLLDMGHQKGLKLSAIQDEKKPAGNLQLRLCNKEPDGSLNLKQLEEAFLHQFDGHTVRPGVMLVIKHFGKKWAVRIQRCNDSPDNNDLSSAMSALKMMEDDDGGTHQSYWSVLSSTRINFIGTERTEPSFVPVGLDDFGGSHDVVDEVKRICSAIFQESETPSSCRGKMSPKGLLLYGPPGTGKSMLVRAVAQHFGAALVTIQGPELFSKYYGETEARLRDKFDEAAQMCVTDKCIVLMDEIDALCPKRDSSSSSSNQSDQERRVVATLLSVLDSVSAKSSHLVIFGVTNRPDALDPALRRPGRLDRELEIRAPTVVERREILSALLRRLPHGLTDQDVAQLASVTHGFVGADLALLCAEASLAAAKRSAGSADEGQVVILPQDAQAGLHLVKPSAMREVLVEVPDVRWTDIGGQTELKLKLKQAVEWPLRYPEAFQRLGVEPPRGLLMFGPPGCSKTMIAKALATESGLNFIAVKGPELFSKWVGESERAVREVFRRARQVAPSIVFLDELDALGSARGGGGSGSSSGVGDRVLAQLLTEMDGIESLKDVTVVAATNRPDMIDKALLRPGRLDRIVYVPLPDEATRREILQLKFDRMPIHGEVALDWLVSSTQGYSGAEVTAVCNEAALRALEEDIKTEEIRQKHFDFALSVVKPRITAETIAFYEKYVEESGMHSI